MRSLKNGHLLLATIHKVGNKQMTPREAKPFAGKQNSNSGVSVSICYHFLSSLTSLTGSLPGPWAASSNGCLQESSPGWGTAPRAILARVPQGVGGPGQAWAQAGLQDAPRCGGSRQPGRSPSTFGANPRETPILSVPVRLGHKHWRH